MALEKFWTERVPEKVYTCLHSLGTVIHQEDLSLLVQKYLYYHLNPLSTTPPHQLLHRDCPSTGNRVSQIHTYKSAMSIFSAPGNQCGPGGMFHEVVQAVSCWGMGEIPGPRYDCVYVTMRGTPGIGMHDLQVARVYLFFSFRYGSETHACVLVHWYKLWHDEPDHDNGMHIMQPESTSGQRNMSVISVDSIVCAAHLLPIFNNSHLDHSFNYTQSLDIFKVFYVNHFIDPRAYELVMSPLVQ
jgi:hypothetical protein